MLETIDEKRPRLRIGPVHIDRVTMNKAIEILIAQCDRDLPHPIKVMAFNAQFLQIAAQQPRFEQISRSADLNVADGASFLFASRLLGEPLPERIPGIDLMIRLCQEGAKTRKRIFLLGGHEAAAERAADVLVNQFPGLIVAGTSRPPRGREFEREVVSQVRGQILSARPDFLFVCFGAPRQEYWIQEFTSDLPVKVVMGNGAAFDVIAGYFRRPPQWIQKAGFEWLYRLTCEPKRLWKRYLVGNAVFVCAFLATWYSRRFGTPLPSE